jgi:hypothetical protein
MVGHNPLWVAKQHGHRIATMLSAYAAWAEGAREEDIAAIWDAMNGEGPNPCSTALNRPPRCPGPSDTSRTLPSDSDLAIRVADRSVQDEDPVPEEETEDSFASEIASSAALLVANYLKPMRIIGGADGTRTRDPRRDRPVF